KRLLRLLGYELRRLPKHHVYGADAYADQKALLSGRPPHPILSPVPRGRGQGEGGVRTGFDVGANVGQTAARSRILFPTADIQGGELIALHGAAGLLKNRASSLIYAEVNFAALYEGQAEFDELLRFLAGYGYSLFGLYNLSHGENSALAWCDAIFIALDLSPKRERGMTPSLACASGSDSD